MLKHPVIRDLFGLGLCALLTRLLVVGLADVADIGAAQVWRWSVGGCGVIVFVVSATFRLRWFERLFGFVGLFLPGRTDRSESGFTVFGNKPPCR